MATHCFTQTLVLIGLIEFPTGSCGKRFVSLHSQNLKFPCQKHARLSSHREGSCLGRPVWDDRDWFQVALFLRCCDTYGFVSPVDGAEFALPEKHCVDFEVGQGCLGFALSASFVRLVVGAFVSWSTTIGGADHPLLGRRLPVWDDRDRRSSSPWTRVELG